MTLRHDPERGIGRPDEVARRARRAVRRVAAGAVELVRERLVLATPPAPGRHRPPRPAWSAPGRVRPAASGEPPEEVVPALGVAVALAVGQPVVADVDPRPAVDGRRRSTSTRLWPGPHDLGRILPAPA